MLLTIQAEMLTPYALALISVLIGVQAWIIRRSISHGETLAVLQAAFKIYLETTGRGAAMVLDSPNPTPPEIRDLLRKYQRRELRAEESEKLTGYLKDLVVKDEAPKAEKSAAYDLLSAMEGLKNMKRKSRWAWVK